MAQDQGPRLSALIVVHDEEAQLPACLALLSFCDEIVVVLDRCADGSRAIALAHGAKIVEGAWPLEGPRRQAGQEACAGRWILEVDADERVSKALADEIFSVLSAREEDSAGADYWRVPFDNYVGNRLVREGWGASFGVGAKAILYRKGIKSWGRQRVHPKVTMNGAAGATLRAQDMVEESDSSTFGKNVARIFGRFYKCYVLRKGYREGPLGLVIALCAGLYPFLSFAKAQALREGRTPHP